MHLGDSTAREAAEHIGGMIGKAIAAAKARKASAAACGHGLRGDFANCPRPQDMQAFPGQPSPTADAEDSTTSGSGHRHPAR